jgi:hypothetical protein
MIVTDLAGDAEIRRPDLPSQPLLPVLLWLAVHVYAYMLFLLDWRRMICHDVKAGFGESVCFYVPHAQHLFG